MPSCLMFFLFYGFMLIAGREMESKEDKANFHTDLIERNSQQTDLKAENENVSCIHIFDEADPSTKVRLNRLTFGGRRVTDHLGRRVGTNYRRKSNKTIRNNTLRALINN
ncbi:uncharacterized protein LOC108111357 isoform X2 [Drosophila eugracilis]|uniref:uncharacterized protein LOC108111357 isoform X2 n=1 Tax=Drosophila eugracilis TaxID=29029 RepID=UPI0007E66DD0|nr:uncharacterized protein LOC108111357 isoform X2 [Drosophila eugracilis]